MTYRVVADIFDRAWLALFWHFTDTEHNKSDYCRMITLEETGHILDDLEPAGPAYKPSVHNMLLSDPYSDLTWARLAARKLEAVHNIPFGVYLNSANGKTSYFPARLDTATDDMQLICLT